MAGTAGRAAREDKAAVGAAVMRSASRTPGRPRPRRWAWTSRTSGRPGRVGPATTATATWATALRASERIRKRSEWVRTGSSAPTPRACEVDDEERARRQDVRRVHGQVRELNER